MHIPTLVKYLLVAWGIPIVMVGVVRAFGPDPNQSRTDFDSKTFEPDGIWIEAKRGSKGSDYFELRIKSPDGDVYFHRDPEPEPIDELDRSIPRNAELRVLYTAGVEGNVILEIAATGAPATKPVLAFETVMGEYASRQRFVYIVAGVWCVLVNLIAYALWKVDISDEPRADSPK